MVSIEMCPVQSLTQTLERTQLMVIAEEDFERKFGDGDGTLY